MPTLYISHPAFLDHLMPTGHPERPDRLRAIERVLEGERFMMLARESAPMGSIETALLAHPEAYVEEIHRAMPSEGIVHLDADTLMSPGTWEAVLRALGAITQAVDEVMERKVHNAFCGIRPPGHHAEASKPMGFCLFNNAAIAARYAQKKFGAERVAIMDFDVHHGNGTQDIFWNDPTVFYGSTHQMPLYPGTGDASETGCGNICNAPLAAGDGSAEFREAMDIAILPAIERFEPDLIVISAGFDAHTRDPLGGLHLTEADYVWATKKLMDIANRHAEDRVVSLLEGGYDLQGLSQSVGGHVGALMRG